MYSMGRITRPRQKLRSCRRTIRWCRNPSHWSAPTNPTLAIAMASEVMIKILNGD
jgi:hypothetical protein